MFADINGDLGERMKYLEEIDAKYRRGEKILLKKLSQISPEAGRLLAFLASYCPLGEYIEVGTSGGYSTLWLSLVAKEKNIKIKTVELSVQKVEIAKETFQFTKTHPYIELYNMDAKVFLKKERDIAFCFLDAKKREYEIYFDLIKDKIVKNGLIVADNTVDFYNKVKPMIEKVKNDATFDVLEIPIGGGILVAKKINTDGINV